MLASVTKQELTEFVKKIKNSDAKDMWFNLTEIYS